MLRLAAGTIGAAVLSALDPRRVLAGNVDECVKFCNTLPPGSERGQCKASCGQTGGTGGLFQQCTGDPTRLCVATSGSATCCRSDQVCVNGACQCPLALSECGGQCLNLATNFQNCGNCHAACHSSFAACIGGQCVCAAGQTACGGVCRSDFTSDPLNCGTCGTVCGTAAPNCCNGSCVNRQTDSLNCGTCGNACSAGQTCVSGVCQTICPTGQIACGTVCVDPQTDPNNCGACGVSCGNGHCVNGVCSACPAGQTVCGESCCAAGLTCCNGACVDLQTSSLNCGACFEPGREPCISIDVGGGPNCGRQCCGGICIDNCGDDNNCGGCGNVCPSGQHCCGGGCCGGLCVLDFCIQF